MAIHKLHIEDYNDIDYQLIAIHSPLDDYRLAYYINQNLPVNLQKSNCNVHIKNKEGETQFTRFTYEDEKKDIFWSLIQNQNDAFIDLQTNDQDLFANSDNEFTTKFYLLPEFKKVDYFLKIENDAAMGDISKITNLIKKIDRVTTVYPVEVEKIKSKNNLIF